MGKIGHFCQVKQMKIKENSSKKSLNNLNLGFCWKWWVFSQISHAFWGMADDASMGTSTDDVGIL